MKKVLITGASRGIGKAIKEILENKGYEVYDFSRTTGVDLLTEEGIKYAQQYMNYFDILINNVGGCGTCSYPDWRIAMEKNYGIMNILTHSYLSSKRNWGRIITISSIYGKEKGHNPWFTAAKAAQIAYMKTLSGKYPGITFNTICPGHIDVGKEFQDNPKIIGKPEDVAYLVEFLCSDKAKHINGACITVDGGESYSW